MTKLLLVGMNTQSEYLNRTEFIIKNALKHRFYNINVCAVNLDEWVKHEGAITANEYLYNIKDSFQPDVVLYSGVEILDYTIFDRYKESKQIIWFYDAPFHVDVCKMGNLVDHLFITANGLVDDYEYWGVNCHWLLEGVNSVSHYRKDDQLDNFMVDVAFVGTPDMHRNELLLKIHQNNNINLGIWGGLYGPPYFGLDNYVWDDVLPYNNSTINGVEYPILCANAKIVLGMNIYNDIYQYFSNRNLFTLGCGGFLLTHYVPGLEQLFQNHKHLVWYESYDEAVDLIKYYLNPKREEKIKQIRSNAFYFAHDNFSMTQQLQKMFDICEIAVND